MSARQAVAAAVLAMGAAASAAASGTCPAYCERGHKYFDAATGLCLPENLPGFEPTARTSLQEEALEARDAIGIAFEQRDPGFALTLFAYDRPERTPEADLAHLKSVLAEQQRNHAGSRIERMGRGSLPIAGEATPALGGIVSWTHAAVPVATSVWVVPKGPRYLRFRATWERTPETEAARLAKAMDAMQLLARSLCLQKDPTK